LKIPRGNRDLDIAIIFPRRFAPVRRSAAQYAVLSRLLDEALSLEEGARVHWLAGLPEEFVDQRNALNRMLTFDRAVSNRTLKNLETSLGSSARGVRALCGLIQARAAP
jgi:hypothetical protein